MNEKDGIKIKGEKKHLPQWMRNILGVGVFLGCTATGVAIGAEMSSFDDNNSVMETVEDVGKFALPVGVGLAIGSSVGLSLLGGIDNGVDKLPISSRPTPESE